MCLAASSPGLASDTPARLIQNAMLAEGISLRERKSIKDYDLKKATRHRRRRDARRTVLQRRLGIAYFMRTSRKSRSLSNYFERRINGKIDRLIEDGLSAALSKDRRITLRLPAVMNLSSHYDETMKYINAIRALTLNPRSKRFYRLAFVSFDHLSEISSSAALLLTAELSRWDDSVRNNIQIRINNWNEEIFERFHSLGFFELFRRAKISPPDGASDSLVTFVKYVKGNHFEKDYRRLKDQIFKLIGETITKWTFLHSGLDEAITNVCHHAYPPSCGMRDKDKNWYLTGAFNAKTRELKVVFCDQGIGIPASLPASKIWERILTSLSSLPSAERRQHATLLKAAMEVSRTSTGESDRGKGLPDMKEFIRQRGSGYLALMSGFGLYKLTIDKGIETHKSDVLNTPVEGTLIIWKVTL